MQKEAAPGPVTEGNSTSNFEGDNPEYQGTTRQGPHNRDGIYPRAALIYREAGWRGVLPLPASAKSPPPVGFTGHDGAWPTDEQINGWIENCPAASNLMLRVNYGLVGIDVDAYDGKTGDRTLTEAESLWGPLPSTYRSTARSDDSTSGIRVFQVPEGVLLRGVIRFPEIGIGDIEIVQPHHRFVVAWPSINPKNSQQYRWYGPDGSFVPDGLVPRVQDLPELPPEWLKALSRDAVREEVFDGSAPNRTRTAQERINEELYQHLIALDDDGAPDQIVATRANRALADLTSGTGSRYDITRDHVAALMRLKAICRVGVPRALAQLYDAYVLEVADTRPQVVAEAEFLRFTEGAALLIAATLRTDPSATKGENGSEKTRSEEGEASDPQAGPSWRPVDLTDLLNGVHKPLQATLFERSDGQCLLYPGMVHSFHGESESGKSLIVQAECVTLINNGRDVLYLDFESDAASIASRLVQLGADPDALAAHFHYIQPEVRPNSAEERRAWDEMLSRTYALAVIDGVTDALGIFGGATKDNDDVARWMKEVPRVIAARTGAAVVVIDHVTKDTANRGRWAIGGQAKMSGLTGAAYTVEVAAPLGRGMRGEVLLRIAKDRPGSVRPHCGSFSKRDRTQEAARIVIDSTVSPPTVIIGAPALCSDEGPVAEKTFRPTNLMERASKVIEQKPAELTKNKVAEEAGGKKQSALLAVGILYEEGYVATESGRSGHPVFRSLKSYREKDDPLSDCYVRLGNAS